MIDRRPGLIVRCTGTADVLRAVRFVAWACDLYKATELFATGGIYINFISEDEDRVQGAYGINYGRLAKVKAQYDPDNFFSVNQDVSPG